MTYSLFLWEAPATFGWKSGCKFGTMFLAKGKFQKKMEGQRHKTCSIILEEQLSVCPLSAAISAENLEPLSRSGNDRRAIRGEADPSREA